MAPLVCISLAESDGDPAVTLQVLAGANFAFPNKRLGTPEEEYRANCARASWLFDKLTKNYLLRCWKAREQVVGRMTLKGGQLHSDFEQFRVLSSRPSSSGPYVFQVADEWKWKRWQRYLFPTSLYRSTSDRKGPWNFIFLFFL